MTEEIEIRPQRGGTDDKQRLRVGLLGCGFMLASLLVRDRDHIVWWLLGAAGLAALGIAFRRRFFRNAYVALRAETVEARMYRSRPRTCRRADVASVVEAQLVAARFGGGIPVRYLFFLDTGRRVLLRTYASYFEAADLERFRAALGAQWDTHPEVETFRMVAKALPGAFPWYLRHIWAVAVTATLALVVVVAAILAAV